MKNEHLVLLRADFGNSGKNERNARVFRNVESQPALLLLRAIKQKGGNWIAAGSKQQGCLFSE
jgi:hypothetical protein